MVMGKPLGFATDSFDAVVSTGVLTVARAPAGSLDRTGSYHQTRWTHCFYATSRRIRRPWIQGKAGSAGVRGQVEASGGKRKVPSTTQRRA